MSLKDQITEDMKTAMRAKDAPRLLTIRGLLAAIKQREVDERIVARRRRGDRDRRQAGQAAQGLDRAVHGRQPARTWSTRKAPSCRCSKATCRSASAPTRSPPRSRSSSPRLGATGAGRHGQGDGRGEGALCRQGRHGAGLGRGEGRRWRADAAMSADRSPRCHDDPAFSSPSRRRLRRRPARPRGDGLGRHRPVSRASSTTGPTSKAAPTSRPARAIEAAARAAGLRYGICRWRRPCRRRTKSRASPTDGRAAEADPRVLPQRRAFGQAVPRRNRSGG